MFSPSRRDFLHATAVASLGLGLGGLARRPAAAAGITTLMAESRVIEVHGRAARVYGLHQADGTAGLSGLAGGDFRARLENRLDEPTLVHWHGLTPPYRQDGVPEVSQPALPPGRSYDYDFPLRRPGTHWMHSHVGLQEQRLLAAPLIVRDPAAAARDEQEVVVLLHDFTFREPQEILHELRAGGGEHAKQAAAPAAPHQAAGGGHGATAAMPTMAGGEHGAATSGTRGPMAGMPAAGAAPMAMHLNDVVYDAFLANDRTLDDPQVIRVEPHGRVRLRVINAAAATNFFLDLGGLEGRLIEVDGNPVAPLPGRRFELATAQRIDLRLALPAGPGAYPVFAQGEGGDRRTGIVLATKTAQVRRLPSVAEAAAPAVGSALESRLRAAEPLSAKPADRRHQVALTGGGADYRWGLNDDVYGAHKPLLVSAGERVEIDLVNRTAMAHPMHLHGHSFQVVALDGRRFSGALRDTLLVPPNAGTTIAFDADNPGNWVFHCHHLYHMHAGMMTTVEYEDLG